MVTPDARTRHPMSPSVSKAEWTQAPPWHVSFKERTHQLPKPVLHPVEAFPGVEFLGLKFIIVAHDGVEEVRLDIDLAEKAADEGG